MSSSGLFKCFLAIVFLLSVAWRIASPSINDSDQKDDLVDFLKRNHFGIATEQVGNLVTIIQANTASCGLKSSNLRPTDRTGISSNISPRAQIACSSSFAAGCTHNGRFY